MDSEARSAAQPQRFTERGAECRKTHVEGYTGPICSCGAGLCYASRDESENQRFNPASSAASPSPQASKIGTDQGSAPEGLGAASAAPAPAKCPRFHLRHRWKLVRREPISGTVNTFQLWRCEKCGKEKERVGY